MCHTTDRVLHLDRLLHAAGAVVLVLVSIRRRTLKLVTSADALGIIAKQLAPYLVGSCS